MGFYNLVNENIVSLLNLNLLEETDKIRVIHNVSDLVQKRLIVRIIEFLDDDNIEKLTDLLGAENNESEVLEFLGNKVPHLEEMMMTEVDKMKEELVAYIN